MSQSLDATLRGATTQDLVLIAFVDRLRDQIAEYTDQNCWESDDPVPLTHPGGGEFCTVSFGDGDFPAEFFAGSSDETLTEMGSVIIAPTIPMDGDRPRRRRRRLVDDSGGVSLIHRKRQILRALFKSEWEPFVGLQPLLRDMPSPVRCSAPGEVVIGEKKMLQMRITVRTVFDWDLDSEADA
ncbi:MAG: hypothetical protein ACO1RT_17575 [Planctomycetaceae bacterium]